MVKGYRTSLVLVLLAVFVFAFSQYALWLGDDIIYDYSFKDGAKITSLVQVVPSQIAHYQVQNGRIPAHFLCQLYIPFLGKTFFAFSNALVYVVWLLMLARLCRVRYDDWRMMALLACLMILGFRTKFTPTCQIGFIWMFALVTAFLLIFRRFGKEEPGRWKSIHLVWAVPLAFLAGWSNEALVVGVGGALGIFVLSHVKRISLPQWGLLAAFGAGAALLCLAPANFVRVGETHASSDLLPPVVLSLAKLAFYLRVSYLLLAFVLYLLMVRKVSLKALLSKALYAWIVWAIMLAFNLFIGVYGNRQLFGMEFAAMLVIVRYVQVFLLPEGRKYHAAGSVLLVALALGVVVVGIGNARFLRHHWSIYDTIDAAYKASDDGLVYYDFSANDVTSNDTYPSDVFSWHALESMSRAYGNHPVLRVVPVLCKHLNERASGNSWEKTMPGTIAIVVDQSNPPGDIRIQRSVFGKRISDSAAGMAEPVFDNDRYSVFLVYEKMPLVTNEGVTFSD